MAYSTTYPPVVAVQPLASGGGSTYGSTVAASLIGGKLWLYISSHTQAEVGASDFIAGGEGLGMKAGDGLINMQIAGKHSYHRVTAVGSTYASVSAGLAISSAS